MKGSHCFHFCFPCYYRDCVPFHIYWSFVFPHLQTFCLYTLSIFLLSFLFLSCWFTGGSLCILKCILIYCIHCKCCFLNPISFNLSIFWYQRSSHHHLIDLYFHANLKCPLYYLVNQYESYGILPQVFI